MAGTLVISTLSDGTNSTSSTNCIQGSAKAWVNFNGTTPPTINASYNVSSVTRNGTGDYTVTFTNAMSDANYAVYFMGVGSAVRIPTNVYYTTSTVRAVLVNGSGSVGDTAQTAVAIWR